MRLGESVPKAFVEIDGRTILRHAVDGLLASGVVDTVVVIVPEELVDAARADLPEGVVVVVGGDERSDSVRAGLAAGTGAELVLVHDAARALTPPSLIARVVAELQAGRTAVIPVLPVSDTIKTVDVLGAVTGTPPRSELRAVQTPQGFDAALLRRAYQDVDGDATDDAGLVERLGERVRTIVGEPEAFKITTPWDLTLARILLGQARSE